MPSFVPEMSANFTSYTVQIIYIALAWILYPLHFSPLPLIKKTVIPTETRIPLTFMNASVGPTRNY